MRAARARLPASNAPAGVPFRRGRGKPHEIGEVIAFLAALRTRFLTRAIVDFSGVWPFGEAGAR